jgi:DNA-binding transcriptional LysR family regulator
MRSLGLEQEKRYDSPNEKVCPDWKGGGSVLNRHLETFILVADSGSFMKAGDKMYVSATAVAKQTNLLEQHLDVKLFHRSSRGLVLTDAGKLIYEETKSMMRHADSVLWKAKELEKHQFDVIRAGVSLMNTGKILLEHYAKVSAQYPDIKLQIVPYEDSANEFFKILGCFGQKIDIIACAYKANLLKDRCNTFHLRDLPLCIAVSKSHKLASKKYLKYRICMTNS